ncbi:Exopolysaccharide biosynthesis protein [Actinomyces succiniciruminis]|uniref:Exopolysaccharide biosynthesis protein n=1 Tax=Actinomyces succiniciruminis TaxID=1522002 RepID=A0A1L7RK66_9ACTO|nr:Exopolysaccharide biosynthesis protein [Actinomyces succiniciruminis]
MSGRSRGRLAELLGNTVIFGLGSLAVKVVSLVLMPLYTSAMTASDYGAAELLNSGIEIVLPLASLGVIEALYRFSIDETVGKGELFCNSVLVLGGGILVAGVLSALAWRIFDYAHAVPFFFLFASACIYKATSQFARGLGHVRRFVGYGFINALVLVIATYALLVHLHAGVAGYLWSYSIGYVVAGAAAFVCSAEYRFVAPLRFDGALLRRMLIYSLPLVPNLLSWWIVSVSGRYVVVWGSGLAAAGLYTAATKMPSLINIISSVFQQAWQFSTAREIGAADSGSFFGRVLRGYSLVTLSMAGVVIVLNRPISGLLLQSEFQDAWRYVPLLMLAAAFGVMSVFFGTFYQALMKSRMLMISTAIGAAVNLLLGVALVPAMGPWGACVAGVVAYAIVLLVRVRDIATRIDMPIDRARIAYQLLLLSVMSICMSCEGRMWPVLFAGACLVLLFVSDVGVLRESFLRVRRAFMGRPGSR